MQIPKAPGDVAAGARLYRKECASCHGREGQGDHGKAVPMLSGQYTNYLWRQVEKYLAGVRIHDPEEPEDRLLAEFERNELRDIFAYAATLDD
jgi:cytochrome c553